MNRMERRIGLGTLKPRRMPVKLIFRCQFCDASADLLTQMSLETAMRQFVWGAYQDALPGRWSGF